MPRNSKGIVHIPILIVAVILLIVVGTRAIVTIKNKPNSTTNQDLNNENFNPSSFKEYNQDTTEQTGNNVNPSTNPQTRLLPKSTIPPLSSFTANGFAYDDRTNDKVFNSDDVGIPNMQFYIYDSYEPERQISTVYTGSDGKFTYTGYIRGKLIMKPTAYNNYSPSSSQIEYSYSGQEHTFSFRSSSAPVVTNTGIIEGDIYHDANKNQIKDSGELGIYFYKLYLIDSSGNYFNTIQNAQTTEESGHFKYVNLPIPGNYTLQLSNPTGDYIIFKSDNSIGLTQTNTQNTNLQIPVYKN